MKSLTTFEDMKLSDICPPPQFEILHERSQPIKVMQFQYRTFSQQKLSKKRSSVEVKSNLYKSNYLKPYLTFKPDNPVRMEKRAKSSVNSLVIQSMKFTERRASVPTKNKNILKGKLYQKDTQKKKIIEFYPEDKPANAETQILLPELSESFATAEYYEQCQELEAQINTSQLPQQIQVFKKITDSTQVSQQSKTKQEEESDDQTDSADQQMQNKFFSNPVEKEKQQPPIYRKLSQDYLIGKLLGSGRFADVHSCRHKVSGNQYAVKIVRKKTMVDGMQEVKVLEKLNHKNIPKIIDYYDEPTTFSIVMELGTRELYQNKKKFNENEARKLISKLLKVVQYCHSQNVIHQDIKPQNIMLGQQSDFEDLKLIDFGKNGDKVDCVNSLYNAPEFLDGLYTKKCDTWAIGVLAFNLLSGRFPFDGKPYLQMVSSILKGSIRFPRTDWARISPSAKDFVQSLLTVRYAQRPTVEMALEHEWLTCRKVRPSTTIPYMTESASVPFSRIFSVSRNSPTHAQPQILHSMPRPKFKKSTRSFSSVPKQWTLTVPSPRQPGAPQQVFFPQDNRSTNQELQNQLPRFMRSAFRAHRQNKQASLGYMGFAAEHKVPLKSQFLAKFDKHF